MRHVIFAFIALLVATAIANAQTPVVQCPAGFTFVPNSLPPACVPPMAPVVVAPAVDNTAAYEAAVMQAQMAQQQAMMQQMEAHRVWMMMHQMQQQHPH
jgi:hypothetical protein